MLNRYRKLIVSLALVVAIVAVFWQLKDCNFISYDDGLYVIENQEVNSGITLKGIAWSFTTFHAANWHPLTWLSHMVDVELYGLNPVGHHFTNLILHIANTLLLFLLLARITKAFWPSAMLAALFALHPLRVESVAWVAERKDVLSAFFWLTTMWAYVWYVEGSSLKRYLLVMLSYALGLMAKPMLVTLPLVLLLLDWWPLGRFHLLLRPGESHFATNLPWGTNKTFAGLILEKVPLLALAAISMVITILAQQQALIPLERIPLQFRLANAIYSYAGYLGKMIWPGHLAIFYPHPGSGVSWWALTVACLVLVGCSSLAIFEARRRPYLAVGWFWYLVTLIPVIGLVQVGGQAMADRYTYIPLIGVFLMLVWGARELTANYPHQEVLMAVAAGIVLTFCGFVTWNQVGFWRNSISLFEHAIAVTDNNYLAYTKLGVAFATQGKADKAIIAYQKAMAINPNYAVPYNNLALIYVNRAKFDEAILLYQKALAINSKFADPYNNLGVIYLNQKKFNEAIALFQKAITINHNYAEPYHNLGLVYASQDKFDQAIPMFQQAINIQPHKAEPYSDLGLAYANLGEFDEAIPLFKKAIALKPNLAAPYNNLGMVYAGQGKTDEAISIFQEAILVNSNNKFAQEMLNKLR